MKRILLSCLCMFYPVFIFYGQDRTAPINRTWRIIASDTSLTYGQITSVCDSLFALAGFNDSTLIRTDSSMQEGADEGGDYVEYKRWQLFWQHRYDVGTNKLHNFASDAIDALAAQNKTTSVPTNCAGVSALQSSITSGPMGWEFVGPRNVAPYSSTAFGNSLQQYLGQVNDIIVNPSNHAEIYIRDQFGGIWKTSTGTSASPTWTCLTDNLPSISGIGVTDFYVEFSSTGPNRIFCVVGVPTSASLPNINNSNPRTVGIFYSTNDGATFNHMDVSSFIPDISTTPILSMAYWPGNSSSSDKYLFLTTQFQIFLVKINDPSSVT
jgi:hypothetical protein